MSELLNTARPYPTYKTLINFCRASSSNATEHKTGVATGQLASSTSRLLTAFPAVAGRRYAHARAAGPAGHKAADGTGKDKGLDR